MQPVHLRRIDLNLLTVLHALLAERHITRAAERLHMSQPAVSHALTRLRAIFGDPILVRLGQEMHLTATAEALAAPLEQIMEEVGHLLAGRRFDPATAVGAVHILATEGAIASVLQPALLHCRAEAPGLVLALASGTSAAYEALRNGTADLALDVFDDAPERGFYRKLLFSNELVCVRSTGGPREPLSVQQYGAASHVAVTGGTDRFLEQRLREAALRRAVSMRLPGYLTAAAIVAHSDLVLTAPRMLGDFAAARFAVEVTPLPFDLPPVSLHLVWHARRHADPLHAWVRERVLAVARSIGS